MAFAACAHPGGGVPAKLPAKPKLVVAIVVDQLAAWLAAERLPLLPSTGGFARLRREGVYAREVRFAHAITETAPGHAALYTACVPRASGIVSNELLDAEGRLQPLLQDASTRTLTPSGVVDLPSVSLRRLTCDTVADRLRALRPAARIISLSFKDRAAILPAGRHADAALWFDPPLDTFVTSSAVADVFPAWADSLADHAAIARARPAQWTLLDPDFVRGHARCDEASPGAGDYCGLGTSFPHSIGGGKIGAAFRASPFADEFLLGLGAQALKDLPEDGPVLLELSLSSNDLIGHIFGPESWEAWDELLRLDGALGRFFDRLDAAVGPEGWSLILSADHGVTVLPERAEGGAWTWCRPGRTGVTTADRWDRPCRAGVRIAEAPLLSQLRLTTQLALGAGEWVEGIVDPYVVLTVAGRALAGARRQQLDRTIRAVLARQAGVSQVFETRSFSGPCPPESDESIAALVCRSVLEEGVGQVGDYYVVTQPGSFFAAGEAHGVAHGSPYLFDRAVPLLARIPGQLPAGRVIDQPLPFETFARTVALALGIDFPAAAAGADLRAADAFERRASP